MRCEGEVQEFGKVERRKGEERGGEGFSKRRLIDRKFFLTLFFSPCLLRAVCLDLSSFPTPSPPLPFFVKRYSVIPIFVFYVQCAKNIASGNSLPLSPFPFPL